MKPRDAKPSNGSMNTIIGEDSSLEGSFEIVGSVKVEGLLKGCLNATERLVVGQGGTVVADVNVRDAIIGGQFTGNVVAESRIELESNARVRADLKTRLLVIHEGATFYGSIEAGEDPPEEEHEREDESTGSAEARSSSAQRVAPNGEQEQTPATREAVAEAKV